MHVSPRFFCSCVHIYGLDDGSAHDRTGRRLNRSTKLALEKIGTSASATPQLDAWTIAAPDYAHSRHLVINANIVSHSNQYFRTNLTLTAINNNMCNISHKAQLHHLIAHRSGTRWSKPPPYDLPFRSPFRPCACSSTAGRAKDRVPAIASYGVAAPYSIISASSTLQWSNRSVSSRGSTFVVTPERWVAPAGRILPPQEQSDEVRIMAL